MLNVPGMARGEDTTVKVNLTGALTGARVNFNVEPRKDGPTMVTARFHELKEAPGGKVYVLWAVSPDNKFVKLGQVVNTGQRNEAEIKSETTLPDFGLLITLEASEATTPTGDGRRHGQPLTSEGGLNHQPSDTPKGAERQRSSLPDSAALRAIFHIPDALPSLSSRRCHESC